MLDIYDRSAQELIDVLRPEGYFDAWDPADLVWPPSRSESGPIDLQGLEARAHLVNSVYRGVPALRDERLADAYARFHELAPAYDGGNLVYLQLKDRFISEGLGTGEDFLQLYQALYIRALAKADLFSPDHGEAALEQARLTRTPLSHAQAVAEALPAVDLADDPRWDTVFSCTVDGAPRKAPLRELLQDVAQRTLGYIAAGELLSTRYNTYNNFGLFGSSVWKVVTDADLVVHRLSASSGTAEGVVESLRQDVLRGIAMLVEFFRAHREDPAKLKPEDYWYGQEYSYLTRDMADLAVRLATGVNRTARKSLATDGERGTPEVVLPPLLAGRTEGRFAEHRHAGKQGEFTRWQRIYRLARWVKHSWGLGPRKLRLGRAGLQRHRRLELAWDMWLKWGEAGLRIFDIEVRVRVDPRFPAVARELNLGSGEHKVLFLPTHQSLLDHTVMFHVLQTPELLDAMGWGKPVPCVILARTGLARAGVRIGPLDITMFGISSEEFDRMLAEVDGYVTLERSGATGPTTPRVVAALEERPGIIYPMATTAAFELQVFPYQHAVFAHVPQDVVLIPMAFRGIHSLWPKCPKGNLNINPGLVEVVVSPPVLGETTLLPRRRSLRIQLEAAALFQAMHISTLLNPEPSAARRSAAGGAAVL
jgi:hypothetical protein